MPTFLHLNVLGDVLDGGQLNFVEAAQTFEAAQRRVEEVADSKRPRQYVILRRGKRGACVLSTLIQISCGDRESDGVDSAWAGWTI